MLFLGNAVGLPLIFPVLTLNVIATGHLFAQDTRFHETQQVSVRQTAHSQAHAHAHTTLHAWLVPTGAMWQQEREIRQCATVTHPKRASRKKQLEEYSRIPGGDNVRCAAHHGTFCPRSNPVNRALVEISLYKVGHHAINWLTQDWNRGHLGPASVIFAHGLWPLPPASGAQDLPDS